jgi:hypothetical protein
MEFSICERQVFFERNDDASGKVRMSYMKRQTFVVKRQLRQAHEKIRELANQGYDFRLLFSLTT